jgi:hypothetical protein
MMSAAKSGAERASVSQPGPSHVARRKAGALRYAKAACVAALIAMASSEPSRAQETVDAAAPAIEYTEEQKFALKALDAELARFDATLAKVDDQQYRNQSKVYLDILKLRAMGIRRNFDQTKYDELRFDLNSEYQRVSLWLANPVWTVPIARDPTVTDPAIAKLKPAAGNPAEVKAALAAADQEIRRIEERASLAPAGPPGEPERRRVAGIKAMRAGLEKNFTTTGWDGLVKEIRKELQRIPH